MAQQLCHRHRGRDGAGDAGNEAIAQYYNEAFVSVSVSDCDYVDVYVVVVADADADVNRRLVVVSGRMRRG